MKLLQRYSVVGLILAICFALISPFATNAAYYQRLEDTISDSDLSATNVTHTIVASTTQTLNTNDDYVEIVFPAQFSAISYTNLTCPSSGTASGTGNTVKCIYSAAQPLAAGSSTFVLTGVTNPSSRGSYTINVYSKDSGGTEIEKSAVKVAIIDDVTVTATVDPTLIFDIDGLATSTTVNGETTTGSSTYDTLAFGTLTVNSQAILGQLLKVSTNAAYGYSVTVAQNQDLTSDAGATINAFVDGAAASTTAQAWQSPAGTLGSADTYGHFGLTAADTSLSGAAFGSGNYKGFETDPIEVMYNDGPADGTTAYVGSSTVAYSIEIDALQEAGEYTNTLTYVCTPTY
ncbi:hypothetical protein GF382_03490 [Candidatus Falkowbacteria bacterium]|nr:hypothetical protein [Candidatus Falkowbacteria bacterium]